MSLTRDLERSTAVRDLARNVLDGRDLVAAVHRRSVSELEQLARAERARLLGDLISAAFRALVAAAASVVRESRLQLAADALTYRTRRPTSR
ncbi:MAG TPA: hypothetical protein VKU84_18565 [Stellaceae bacterium]|nr:hypothetical protein [Stellaceae bacterium]